MLVLSACGYRFAGSGDLPGRITKVHIAMLENQTSVSGVESTFTNDLIYEFSKNRKGSVVKKDLAEAVLKGVISSITVRTIAHTSDTEASEMRVTATLQLTLETEKGEIIWVSGKVSEDEAYTVVSGDKSSTDANKNKAVLAVSERLAELVYSRLTDNF